jgi:uncharacterized membrane protein
MLWFAATVILGILALGFLVSGLRYLFIEELVAAAILILATYWCAVQGGLIQPVV